MHTAAAAALSVCGLTTVIRGPCPWACRIRSADDMHAPFHTYRQRLTMQPGTGGMMTDSRMSPAATESDTDRI